MACLEALINLLLCCMPCFLCCHIIFKNNFVLLWGSIHCTCACTPQTPTVLGGGMLGWQAIPIVPGLKAFQDAKIGKVLGKPGLSRPPYKQRALQFCLLFMSFGPKLERRLALALLQIFTYWLENTKLHPLGFFGVSWDSPEELLKKLSSNCSGYIS